MSNKQKECYWDKSIDMSKATLQVDGKVVCKFDNDNQTIIVNEGFKTLRELELEARVKDLEERIINHSNTVEEYCSRLANKEKECEELKAQLNDMACMDDDNVLCYPRQELKKECEKYEQTLFEIKIYCKTALCVSTSKNDINFIQMIIDIIDKAMRQKSWVKDLMNI